jgi:hypothetical protein
VGGKMDIDSFWRRPWPTIRVTVPIAVAGGTALTLASIEAGGATGQAKFLWILLAVVGGAVNIAFPAIEQSKRDKARKRESDLKQEALGKAEKAAAAMRVAMVDSFGPIARELGLLGMARTKSVRETCCRTVINLVLATIANTGPRRTRANYYRLDQNPPRSLRPDQFSGRYPEPKTIFTEGTRKGDYMFDILYSQGEYARGWDLRPSIHEDPPPDWDPSANAEYKTYAAVPIFAGDTPYGMLIVDSLKPGDLKESDIPIIRAFAALAGAALVGCDNPRSNGQTAQR